MDAHDGGQAGGGTMVAPARDERPGSGWTTPVVEVSFERPGRQRRWTIAVRVVLALPHLLFAGLVTIVALVATVVAWFIAVALGRLPKGLADFLGLAIQYRARVDAYASLLLTDTYPAFDLGSVDDAVTVDIPRNVRLNRAAVLLRAVLLLPVAIVVLFLGYGLFPVRVVAWLVALIMGRLPAPLFDAFASALRYRTRVEAYAAMLTSEYPRGLFGDRPRVPAPPDAASPAAIDPGASHVPAPAAPPVPVPPPPTIRTLVLSRSAQVILGVILVLGAWAVIVDVGAAVGSGEPETADLAAAEWVTVTEVEGVRFDMPRQPEHSTEPIPGTDVAADFYASDLGIFGSAAFVIDSELPAGDTRTDVQVLQDSANGLVTTIGGTFVDNRPVVIDGEPAVDLEATTPQEGGLVVLARISRAGDLLVGVETVFHEHDRDLATATHDRMAGSIRFDG